MNSMRRSSKPSLSLLVAVAGLLVSGTASGRGNGLMDGKHRTRNTIRFDRVVDAKPSEAFRLWISVDGVQRFFAPAARIDAREGGEYTILFAPKADPEGLSHGTKGARILRFRKDREVWFEWITFAGDSTLGVNGPPVAALSTRNEQPLPTWVELRFEAVPGHPNQTRVRFAHYGFREGPLWEASYAWFSRAWKNVLDGMESACRSSA